MVACYRDSLVIDRNYLIDPASLHCILQCLDLQSVLFDIRFECFDGFTLDFSRSIYACRITLCILRYLIKIENSIGALVVALLEKTHSL